MQDPEGICVDVALNYSGRNSLVEQVGRSCCNSNGSINPLTNVTDSFLVQIFDAVLRSRSKISNEISDRIVHRRGQGTRDATADLDRLHERCRPSRCWPSFEANHAHSVRLGLLVDGIHNSCLVT